MSYEKYKDVTTSDEQMEASIRIAMVENILRNPEKDVTTTLEILYWTAWVEGFEKGKAQKGEKCR